MDEISSGGIVYRETKDYREYLLLKSRTGDWEFPKGGIEGEEELQQATLREIEEETGIEQMRIIDGFREAYTYTFYRNSNTIDKKVHLFIVKSFNSDVDLSPEHHDYQWRDFEEAKNTLSHRGPTEILEEAHEYLNKAQKTTTH